MDTAGNSEANPENQAIVQQPDAPNPEAPIQADVR
jgi:hypothetical protein